MDSLRIASSGQRIQILLAWDISYCVFYPVSQATNLLLIRRGRFAGLETASLIHRGLSLVVACFCNVGLEVGAWNHSA
jgi:hypothetical protein